MILAIPKEGPRAPLFYCVLVALAWSTSPAWSQNVDIADLEACAALPGDDAKLSCFNAIVESARGASAAETASRIDAESSTAAATLSSEASPELQQNPDKPGDVVPPIENSRPAQDIPGNDATQKAVVAERVTIPPGADSENSSGTTVAVASGDESDFGREHLDQQRSREPESVHAIVVNVTHAYNDALEFHMSNGQVWRQIEPRRYPYPRDGEFAVTISQGVMGDYRLRIDSKGRMVRIRRIK